MKVEHISGISNHVLIRDTKDIYPETINFFKPFGLKEGKKEIKIDRTTLTCRIHVFNGIAVFSLLEDETLLFVNVCCFSATGRDQAIAEIEELYESKNYPLPIVSPKSDFFIYTIPIMRIADPETLMTCGEIELYIYFSLFLASL